MRKKKWHGLRSLPPTRAGSSPVRWGRMGQPPLLPVCFHRWTVELCHSAENSPADRSSAVYKSKKFRLTIQVLIQHDILESRCKKKRCTYLSPAHFNSKSTLLYFLLVSSTLEQSCGALEHLGEDLRKVSASCNFADFSGSILRTAEVMSYEENTGLRPGQNAIFH